MERGHILVIRRDAKNIHHGLFGIAYIPNPFGGLLGEQVDFFIGNIRKSLEHLIIDLCVFDPFFLPVTDTGAATVFFKIFLVFLPGMVITIHFELAFCKNDLNVFFYNIVFPAIDIADDRRKAV